MNEPYLVASKICHRCSVEKPAAEFGRQRARKDGLQAACKACKNEARRKDPNRRYKKPSDLVEDYLFLRGHDVDHLSIAKRTGVVPEYLRQVVDAADCRVMERGEQECYDRILLCVGRGKTFSRHDMPFSCDVDGVDFNVAVNVAVRQGLCEPVGKRVHVLSNRGNPVIHYEPVIEAEVLAVA